MALRMPQKASWLAIGFCLAVAAGLLVMNALLDRVAFTDPPTRRLLSRSRI